MPPSSCPGSVQPTVEWLLELLRPALEAPLGVIRRLVEGVVVPLNAHT
jgi:hypothetical protein